MQTPTLCYLNQSNQCLLDFYSHCNIDFHNLCYQYDEEDIIKRTVKMEAWTKNQEELDYAISCFQSFSYELHPDHHSLEIYSNEVSKATGILDVLHELNIDIKDSYCFGDGPNDVEMFETVGHPIAMGNAIEDIKKRAEIICPSVQENGVAIQLEKMFNEY